MPKPKKTRRSRRLGDASMFDSDSEEQSQQPLPPVDSTAPPWLGPLLTHMGEENRRRDDVLLQRLMDCTSQHHDVREPVDKSPDDGPTSSSLVVPRSGSETPESMSTGGSHLPKAIPPPPLTPEISLRNFLGWRATWEDYATLARLNRCSREEQLAAFRTCLSVDMRSTLEHAVGIGDDPTDVSSMLDTIQEYLRSQRSVAVDRVAFAERIQEVGEAFDDFLVALKKIAANAELCPYCADQQLVTRLMCGIRDTVTRRELLAVHPFPSLRQVIDVCRSRESAANNDDLLSRVHLSGPPVVATAVAPHHQDHSTAWPQCGYPRHTGKRCPAQGSLCNKCGQLGHFARVCTNAKSLSTGHPASKSAPQTRQVLVLDVSSPDLQRAPTVVVELGNAYCPDVYGTCVATPDTGAEANILGVNMLTSLGIPPEQMCPPVMTSILAANGFTLTCVGTLVFAISYSGSYSTTEVLVCQDHQGMLLSWFTCRDLAIIPSRYPEAISRVAPVVASPPRDNPSPADRAKVREQLLIEFADVFSTNETLRCMEGPPMKIHVQPDAPPFAVHAARPIPFAWREEVQEQLDTMVQQGVIEPLGDQPSEWCYPLVIVPKSSGGVRICVDMTKLNKHVARATYPLTTPREAVAAISPSSRFFTTLDATHGYWQVPLAEEHQILTTFRTPRGPL